VTAAAAGAAANMPDDFRVSITNAPGKGAYPISSFTWLLIPSRIQDATKEADSDRFPAVDAGTGTEDGRAPLLRAAAEARRGG